MNKKVKKHNRKRGRYSLSKITMDDVALSRKAKVGGKLVWVYKYIAVDVVSGYKFRPQYIIGKPTISTIIEAFRNMFIELMQAGLPMPGELEVENALMKDIPWLNDMFTFVRFCASATEKRAEHYIRAFKYGVSHRNNHTRGRWFARHEAYKAVRYKKNGDFVEPEHDVRAIIEDDLRDVDEWNNELHPLQKTYPRMTRRDVLIKHANPNLETLKPWYLYQYIGNESECTIYNNDYVKAANGEFELTDYTCLKKLKPNSYHVTAYWLPEADGSVKRCYIYQGDTYIGEATNRADTAYNECAVERDELDNAKMLEQNKRRASQLKIFNDRKQAIPNLGKIDAEEAESYTNINVEDITVGEQPKMDETEYMENDNADFGFDLGDAAKTSM